MKRTSKQLTAIGAVSLAAVGAVSTSSNLLPATSTASYQSVKVTGATMTSINYAVATNTITGFTVNLKGRQFTLNALGAVTTTALYNSVTARFGPATANQCVIGAYDAVNDQTPSVCTGFTQQSNRSWALTVTVS